MTNSLWRLDEGAFLRTYAAATLRKPQVVSDNVLTGIFLADASHRVALTALLLQEAVEAARRLLGVWVALTDRSRPVAERLAGPLPGADPWGAFVLAVRGAAESPTQLLHAMAIDSSALESAEELAAFTGLDQFEGLLRLFEAGPPMVISSPGPTLLLANVDQQGSRVQGHWSLADDDVIALGDATGYFVSWARDFLEAYIEGREGHRS